MPLDPPRRPCCFPGSADLVRNRHRGRNVLPLHCKVVCSIFPGLDQGGRHVPYGSPGFALARHPERLWLLLRPVLPSRAGDREVSSAGEPTMTRATIAGGAFAAVLVLLAVAAGYRALNQDTHPA